MYPRTHITSDMCVPFQCGCRVLCIPWYPPWIRKSLVICAPFHMQNFAGSLKDMDTTKYRNPFEYVKNHKYPPGFSQRDKLILRRGARNFELDPKLESLFYLDEQKDGPTSSDLSSKKTRKRGYSRNATRQIPLAMQAGTTP